MFSQLYKFLKEKGFDVYSIGQHKGICTSPYLVLKENGTSEIVGKQLVNEVVEIMVYYPVGQYSKMKSYTDKLKNDLGDIKTLRRVLDPMPTIIDDEKEAYMTSYYYRKIKTKEGA